MPQGFTFILHLFLSGYTKKALTSNLIVFLVNLNLIGFAYILNNIIRFFIRWLRALAVIDHRRLPESFTIRARNYNLYESIECRDRVRHKNNFPST